MSILAAIGILSLCALLLLRPELAQESARQALSIFYRSVLPSLFPFYVLTSWLARTTLLRRITTGGKGASPLCFLIGAISGYPVGARFAASLGRERLAAASNLCSPMFLLGVVAVSMYKNAAMFAPVAIAHYGSAAVYGILSAVMTEDEPSVCSTPPAGLASIRGGFFSDIGEGMFAMLRVGGCIVFFYVTGSLAANLLLSHLPPVCTAVLLGLVEMTSGCSAVSALPLPPRVAAGLIAFFVSFGGLSVFAQTMLTAELRRPLRYLSAKLAQGFLAALIAYFLVPLFLPEAAPTMGREAAYYHANAKLGAAFVAASCLGLAGAYLFSEILSQFEKRAWAGRPGSYHA